MKIIDCSYLISNNSPVYPGDPKVNIEAIASLATDGYQLSQASLTMHVATHLDALSHLSNRCEHASDFPIELMISNACVLDVSNLSCIELTKSQIQAIQQCKTVFLHTGWSKYYGTDQYFYHPVLSIDAVDALIQADVKTIVLDMPSVDYAPYPIHKLFFESGIWIVENVLMNAEVLALEKFIAVITPIKIEAEAALTRVLVIEKDSKIR